jgi:hypothetical protein
VYECLISAVKRAEFLTDKKPYKISRGCWYDIMVLNGNAPTEDRNVSLYKKLQRAFRQIPKYHMKRLIHFNAKIEK